jgi:succinate dehydrogenase / fumarate reductase cytochrome b subunit
MLVDFWEKGPKYQKPMLWTIAVIWVAVMLPGAFFMLKRTVGIMFGGN